MTQKLVPKQFTEECGCVLEACSPDKATWSFDFEGTKIPARVSSACDHHMRYPQVMSIGGYVLNSQAEDQLAEFRRIPRPQKMRVEIVEASGMFIARGGGLKTKASTASLSVEKLVNALREKNGSNFSLEIETREARKASKDFPWF
jgi:hypothetical protein